MQYAELGQEDRGIKTPKQTKLNITNKKLKTKQKHKQKKKATAVDTWKILACASVVLVCIRMTKNKK